MVKGTAIYELEATDMTHCGGPMGSEYTESLWHKFFSSLQKAKDYAEKDYSKQASRKRKITWIFVRDRFSREYTSRDLGFIMYDIRRVQIED